MQLVEKTRCLQSFTKTAKGAECLIQYDGSSTVWVDEKRAGLIFRYPYGTNTEAIKVSVVTIPCQEAASVGGHRDMWAMQCEPQPEHGFKI